MKFEKNMGNIYINVDSFILEATRRCNMRCKMCIRGIAQNNDMPKTVIKAAFDAIDGLREITVSGGEPFLVPRITAGILTEASSRDAVNMFISTNGMVSPESKSGAIIMDAAMLFKAEMEFYDGKMFQVSVDSFHAKTDLQGWEPYVRKGQASYVDKTVKALPDGQMVCDIANRGLARDNGIGVRNLEVKVLCINDIEEMEDDIFISVERIYVNVFGHCFADCDLSYEMQDNGRDSLPLYCYLGDISNLRQTIISKAADEFPDLLRGACGKHFIKTAGGNAAV